MKSKAATSKPAPAQATAKPVSKPAAGGKPASSTSKPTGVRISRWWLVTLTNVW